MKTDRRSTTAPSKPEARPVARTKKNRITYPPTDETIDRLASIVQRKFGFVTIGIIAGESKRFVVGQCIFELWGIYTDREYVVVKVGDFQTDWAAQTAYLSKYFGIAPNPTKAAQSAKAQQFAHVKLVNRAARLTQGDSQ